MSWSRGAGAGRPALRRRRFVWALLAVAASAVLAGCGDPGEGAAAATAGPTATPSNTASTPPPLPPSGTGPPVAAAPSWAATAAPSLPPGFPVAPGASQLPLPSGDPTLIARWRRDGIGREVYEFYAAALPAAGYPITLLGPGGGGAIIRFEAAPGVVWQLDMHGDLETTVIELRPEHP